jgi:hypothetical protein
MFFFSMLCCTDAQSQGGDFWSFASKGARIRGFELPLHNKEGVENGVIRGREAVIIDRFQIRVSDLIYESTPGSEDQVFLRVTEGIYNRENNTLSSDGQVLLKRGKIEISGNGLIWNIQEQRGLIREHASVVISSNKSHIRNVTADNKE